MPFVDALVFCKVCHAWIRHLGQNIPIIIGRSSWEQGQDIFIWFISFGVLALLATAQ